MRHIVMCLVAAALVAFAPNEKEEGKAIKEDLKKLEGAWVATSSLAGGVNNLEKMKEVLGKVPPVTLTFRGDRYTFKIADNVVGQGRIKIDPATHPKQIDLTPKASDDNNRTSLGLYKIDKDTLTLVFTPAGEKRPKAFISKKGTKLELYVMKRMRP